MTVYLGLDIGGTSAKFGLVDESGTVIDRNRFPVKAHQRGADDIIDEAIEQLGSMITRNDAGSDVAGLAIGAAGWILPGQGVVVAAPNLPGWNHVALGPRLSKALDLPVKMENDANLFTLGEWLCGAGQGLNYLAGVTLGTGVGGGLILDGRLYNGPFGTSAEVGHMVVEPNGRKCKCGSYGCLETLASATAMTITGRELLEQGHATSYAGRIEDLTSKVLFDLADQDDPLALEVFNRAGKALGIALTSIFNLLGLEGAVIGGGAGAAFKHMYESMFDEFSKRVFVVDPQKVRIVQSALRDDAPLAGAPALFR
jgi:glucokinase